MKRHNRFGENQGEEEYSNRKHSRNMGLTFNYSSSFNRNFSTSNEPVPATSMIKEINLKTKQEWFKRKYDDAIAEKERTQVKLSQALTTIKQKDDEIIQLRHQYSKFGANTDVKALKKKVWDLEEHLRIQKKATSEAISREERLERRIYEYRQNMEAKENIIKDLQKQRKKESEELQKIEKEFDQIISKYGSLENAINELLDADKEQKAEIVKLQKELDEAAQELGNIKMAKNQETFEVSIKTETFKSELLDSQNSIKLKDDKIVNLQAQLHEMKKLFKEKCEELQKFEENSDTEIEKLHVEISIMKNKLGEAENLKSATNQEMTTVMKQVEETEAENDKLKSKLDAAKKAAEDIATKIEKSTKDRAKEMFKDWKKEDKEKRKSEKQNCCSCSEKDKLIQNLQKELEKQKELNETLLNDSNTSFNTGPKWLIPQEKCENIFHTNESIKPFLQQYTSELLNRAEILLPEEKISSKKMEEVKAVIIHFFKPDSDAIKELLFGILKNVLNAKRYPTRSTEYKNCNSSRSIGFTSDGIKFYYSFKKHNIWKPCSDKKGQNILPFRKTSCSSFGIPSEYASSDYILILQNSDNGNEPKIHKMSPTTGAIELVTKTKAEK